VPGFSESYPLFYRRLSAFVCGFIIILLGVLGALGGSIIDLYFLAALASWRRMLGDEG
jgi:hypothetical protein